jgi:hypothetical protein
MFFELKQRMHAKSAALLLSIETRLDRLMMGWLLVAGLATAVRIATSPLQVPIGAAGVLPYLLLIVAPFASMVLALRWFAGGDRMPQPGLRLAHGGRWRRISSSEARAHPLYGTSGLMVSLLVGMLINVPVRAAEYLTAMPALSGRVPPWLSTLHVVMTLDVVLLSSLYTIAFVAALRRVPLFPRLLAAIWVVDLVMQLSIAKITVAVGGLPEGVAVALENLLEGNVKKVLISVALWLPYLLMSARVNVTYRSRIPA